MSLFLFLSCISLRLYCRKSLAKSGGFGKNIKRGDAHIGGLSIEGDSNLLLHTDIQRLKGGHWSPVLLGGLNWRGDLRPLFIPWIQLSTGLLKAVFKILGYLEDNVSEGGIFLKGIFQKTFRKLNM